MTNEEKWKEIANAFQEGTFRNGVILGAGKMTEWKDQQFKEFLTEQKEKYMKSIFHNVLNNYDLGYLDAIDEIINELFKEG